MRTSYYLPSPPTACHPACPAPPAGVIALGTPHSTATATLILHHANGPTTFNPRSSNVWTGMTRGAPSAPTDDLRTQQEWLSLERQRLEGPRWQAYEGRHSIPADGRHHRRSTISRTNAMRCRYGRPIWMEMKKVGGAGEGSPYDFCIDYSGYKVRGTVKV
ncbi:hypothetical protein BD311DRAFT_747377 [Dichomitus squalens]|uniref:Uncharacterized protein n=1 Tax=Dichomitus squalens TaxID=114155 RepID=A0A4Q9N187_9APHY|nr:hypothetical protein BD311DRAFT_747377 [Dichomitus squalens]